MGSPEVMKQANFSCKKLPCIAAIREFAKEEKQIFLYDDLSAAGSLKTRMKSFLKWLEPKKVPALIPADEETEFLFLKDHAATPGNANAIYFGSDEAARDEIYSLAVEMSTSTKKLRWVHATNSEFGESLANMVGVKPAGFPEFVLWQFGKEEDDDRIYKLSKQEGNSGFPTEDLGESVRSLIENWKAGKVGLMVAEKDPVLAVTTKSFEQVVLDSSKDVLVEFYAPWCGHCKQLAPEYKEVARHYEKDPSVAIVKIDATQHSHKSAKVSSYPTLLVYLASDKQKPITLAFESGRDKQSIIDTLEKHRRGEAAVDAAGTGTCAAGDPSCKPEPEAATEPDTEAAAAAAAKGAGSAEEDDDDEDFKEF